jgi:hypothetical protein
MSIDTTFCRALLAAILPDVRKTDPTIKVSEAWVYKVGKDHWEFHFRKFYWHGGASNAYEARFNGWESYLRHVGAKGYELSLNAVADRFAKEENERANADAEGRGR